MATTSGAVTLSVLRLNREAAIAGVAPKLSNVKHPPRVRSNSRRSPSIVTSLVASGARSPAREAGKSRHGRHVQGRAAIVHAELYRAHIAAGGNALLVEKLLEARVREREHAQGDRSPLGVVAVEQRRRGALRDCCQLPADVVRVLNAGVHPLATGGRVEVRDDHPHLLAGLAFESDTGVLANDAVAAVAAEPTTRVGEDGHSAKPAP